MILNSYPNQVSCAEMVSAYWLIGRDIIEEEQSNSERAEYGVF